MVVVCGAKEKDPVVEGAGVAVVPNKDNPAGLEKRFEVVVVGDGTLPKSEPVPPSVNGAEDAVVDVAGVVPNAPKEGCAV